MNGLSSNTGRFAAPKVEIKCRCGKRYRVSATKAGKRLRCKKCRSTIAVPGSMKISMRSRKAILEEFGIDANEAEQAYEQKKETRYACSKCSAEIPSPNLKASYGSKGLTCGDCRLQAEKSKQEEREGDTLESWTRSRTTHEAALRKSVAMSALFAAGTAGLVHTLFGPPAWIVGAVALTVAAAGGRAIYTGETS